MIVYSVMHIYIYIYIYTAKLEENILALYALMRAFQYEPLQPISARSNLLNLTVFPASVIADCGHYWVNNQTISAVVTPAYS